MTTWLILPGNDGDMKKTTPVHEERLGETRLTESARTQDTRTDEH